MKRRILTAVTGILLCAAVFTTYHGFAREKQEAPKDESARPLNPCMGPASSGCGYTHADKVGGIIHTHYNFEGGYGYDGHTLM
jgi:hypothetical protein